VGLLERIADVRNGAETRYSADTWLTDYYLPTQFGFNGGQYAVGGYNGLVQTLAGNRASEIVSSLPGYMAALRQCPPAFAAELVRASVLSQARFTFRNLPGRPNARKQFGTKELGILEVPWPNATTGELIARMEWHAGVTGNAYVTRRAKRLKVLRPDWVAVLYGSEQEPEDAIHALDGQLLGYVYQNGGLYSSGNEPTTLLPEDVAHWSPIPDPEAGEVGMSWVTPAIREMQGDRLTSEHKIRFFENGATPNLVVKGIPAITKVQFDEIVDAMEAKHAGVANAYRTLYLTAGADATVVGANLDKLDLKAVTGTFETRIAALSRVHPVILGIAEGLAGSALNAGNFGMARRIWADTWIYPTLQDLVASLATIVNVPSGAELWFDVADMPILREDAKDAAEIGQTRQTTITGYVREGFTPDSSIAAAIGQDEGLLKHTGNMSVQLQPPGTGAPDPKLKQQSDEAALISEQMQAISTGLGTNAFDPASVVAAVEAGDLKLLKPAPQQPGGAAGGAPGAGTPGSLDDLDWGLFGGPSDSTGQPPGPQGTPPAAPAPPTVPVAPAAP
jgi:phage portal protein BeeE